MAKTDEQLALEEEAKEYFQQDMIRRRNPDIQNILLKMRMGEYNHKLPEYPYEYYTCPHCLYCVGAETGGVGQFCDGKIYKDLEAILNKNS